MSMHDTTLTAPAALTPLEWRVVTLAKGEARNADFHAVEPTGLRARLRRLAVMLTGIRPTQPLADPRLEALRLFVCMIRRKDRRVERIAEELMGFGYSREQLGRLTRFARA